MERTYSIKDLELLSGIKAHTIRIWEQRHDLLHPVRTDTNIRRYGDQDLRLLLNVAILNKKGYKISKIAAFSQDEVAREAYRMLATDHSTEIQMDGLRQAMITLDEVGFNKIFANLTVRHGFEDTMIRVIYPFLELIGVLWQTGSILPMHEHFASSIIRQKIIVALDMLPVPKGDMEKGFVLACPELEFHEIGLLFANYILRSRGIHTVYIGASVPLRDMNQILEETGIQNIFISIIVNPSAIELPGYIKEVRSQLPAQTNIFLSGRQTESLKSTILPDKTHLLMRIDKLGAILEGF